MVGMMKIILLMMSFSCGFLLMVSCSSEPDEVKSEQETKKERASFSPIPDSNITIPLEIVREAPDFVYPDGPVTIYYDDGSKHSSGLYKDGKKEGSWVYFGTEPEVTILRETYEGGVKVSEESFE